MKKHIFGLRTVAATAGAIFLAFGTASAVSNRVTVSGTVRYPSGSAVPASVTIVDSLGLERIVPVDDRGSFAAVGFTPGKIIFRVQSGDRSAGTAALYIAANQSGRCNFTVDPPAPDGITPPFLSVPEPACTVDPSLATLINL